MSVIIVDAKISKIKFLCVKKPQSNGPLYSNTVIGTLAVDVWVVTFGKARSGPGQAAAPAQSPHRCTKCSSG